LSTARTPASGEQFISTVLAVFAPHQPTSPLLTVTGRGWKGVRRTFLDKTFTPNVEVVVIIATGADGALVVTWNETVPKITERAPVYERIFQSLQLSTPRR
jgi:hypothetical protein